MNLGAKNKEDDPKPPEVKLWSRAQEEAFDLLLEIADVFFQTNWTGTGLRPRLDPLIVEPTGMGKSHLARALARKLGLPLLRLSYNEWLIMGAKETPYTLARVHTFVEHNSRGLIHIDELDKFKSSHRSDWSTSVFGEVFLLLDRSLQQPARGVAWNPILQAKLRRSFLVIGSGTWQMTWASMGKSKIGFGHPSSKAVESIQSRIASSDVIPVELLRRFSSELVVLSPATSADYHRGAQLFGLDRMAEELGVDLDYADAVERELGARWLEETFAHLLMLARRQGKTILPPDPLIAPEPPPMRSSEADVPGDQDSDIPF